MVEFPGWVQAVRGAEDLPLWEAAERVSRGMLLGARAIRGRMFPQLPVPSAQQPAIGISV